MLYDQRYTDEGTGLTGVSSAGIITSLERPLGSTFILVRTELSEAAGVLVKLYVEGLGKL